MNYIDFRALEYSERTFPVCMSFLRNAPNEQRVSNTSTAAKIFVGQRIAQYVPSHIKDKCELQCRLEGLLW